MKCNNCGFENPTDSLFCEKCGEKLIPEQVQQDTPESIVSEPKATNKNEEQTVAAERRRSGARPQLPPPALKPTPPQQELKEPKNAKKRICLILSIAIIALGLSLLIFGLTIDVDRGSLKITASYSGGDYTQLVELAAQKPYICGGGILLALGGIVGLLLTIIGKKPKFKTVIVLASAMIVCAAALVFLPELLKQDQIIGDWVLDGYAYGNISGFDFDSFVALPDGKEIAEEASLPTDFALSFNSDGSGNAAGLYLSQYQASQMLWKKTGGGNHYCYLLSLPDGSEIEAGLTIGFLTQRLFLCYGGSRVLVFVTSTASGYEERQKVMEQFVPPSAPPDDPQATASPSQTPEPIPTNPYEQYIGSWHSEENDCIFDLTIHSIENNAVTFSIEYSVLGPVGWDFSVPNLTGTLSGSTVTFDYADNEENKGKGTLELGTDTITYLLVITEWMSDSALEREIVLSKSTSADAKESSDALVKYIGELCGYPGEGAPREALEAITTLDLSGMQFDDYSHLSNLKGLKKLDLGKNTLPADIFDILTQIPDLETLRLKDCKLSNGISGIEQLDNLDYLSLENCGLTDITPLASLAKMEHLNLKNNDITDLSPLFELKAINWLNVADNDALNVYWYYDGLGFIEKIIVE